MKAIITLTFFLMSLAVQGQECNNIPELNQQIVELTLGKLKKKVGRGECWDLAKYVLDETEAEWDNFEVYGRLINRKKECVYPGDIIQFERIKLKWKEDDFSYEESMKHHTAIVVEVKNKNEVVLAHQNTQYSGRKVGKSSLFFDRIVSGKLYIYRPVK